MPFNDTRIEWNERGENLNSVQAGDYNPANDQVDVSLELGWPPPPRSGPT